MGRIQFKKIAIIRLLCLLTLLNLVGCSREESLSKKDNEFTDAYVAETDSSEELDLSGDANLNDNKLNDSSYEFLEAEDETEESKEDNPTVVFLGDSLTQGSLGDENDNLAGSPPVLISQKYGLSIEPYGFYGNNTNDILWRYTDEGQENQQPDPEKVYVFWTGSNDWVVNGTPNDSTEDVIRQLDDFIAENNLDKYIVLGTTARYELRNTKDGIEMYKRINSELAAHYGSRYLETASLIGPDGYGPDQVHLTAASYAGVAEEIYKKLLEMEYIYE